MGKRLRLFVLILILVLVSWPLNLSAAGVATAADPIAVFIDGQAYEFDSPPVVREDRTLVPMRALFEALGAEVVWEAQTRTAVGTRHGATVRIPLGSTQPTVNGEVRTIDVPAQLIDNRTYIPLRFVGEALGDDVVWDGGARAVRVTRTAPTPDSLTTAQITPAAAAASPAPPGTPRIIYEVEFAAGAKTAAVSIHVQDPHDRVRLILLNDYPGVPGPHVRPDDFITNWQVTRGSLQPADRGSRAYQWQLSGVTAGTLSYTVKTDIQGGGGYVAYGADDWIITNGAFLFMVREITAIGPKPDLLLRVRVPAGWVAHAAFPEVEPQLFDLSGRRGAVFPADYPKTFIVAGDESVIQAASRDAGGATFTAVAPHGGRRPVAAVADLVAAVGAEFQSVAGWGPARVLAVVAPEPLRQGGEAGHWSYMAGDTAPIPPDLTGNFGLHSHELFHVYQDYLPLEGWLNEGIATYYEYYGLLRAGRITAQQFWDQMQSVLAGITPGQTVTQDPYLHGAILTMAADILLRLDSEGRYSLDDVIRYLNLEHGSAPITAEDFVEIMSRFTDRSYAEFLNRFIRGDELPTDIFARAGPELYSR